MAKGFEIMIEDKSVSNNMKSEITDIVEPLWNIVESCWDIDRVIENLITENKSIPSS
ncbi:MAG: hypothetical protein JRJ23_01075 [Deltaproteobacteria bacterium]|nr:hypothetical protein [Deltaproteobacteria bacterium]